MIKELMSQLNDKQKEVVFNTDGAYMVLAGAGSGKTKAITSKILYLLEEKNINPDEILAVTFTNKAAKEMQSRVGQHTSIPPWALNISTFHSFCVRFLKEVYPKIGKNKNFSIYDDSESKSVIKKILRDYDISPKEVSPKAILSYIDKLKNFAYYPDCEDVSPKIDLEHEFYDYYLDYEKELSQANALDFGGLIVKVLEILQTNKEIREEYQNLFKYIMIDEYQDTNKSQFDLINILAQKHKNICVVGDIDQSIYSFRNADIRNILSFEKIYPDCKIIKLEQNYRSTKTVIEAASSVINYNAYRKEKNLWTNNEKGELINVIECRDDRVESELIGDMAMRHKYNNSLYSMAIFYRNNAQSRLIEESLRKRNIPYVVVGGMKFYDRKEIKDMISYLKVLYNKKDNAALMRIINTPSRGLGKTSLIKLEQEANTRNLSFWETIQSPETKLSKKASQSLENFVTCFKESEKILNEDSLTEAFNNLLEKSQYIEALENSGTFEDMARIDNLKELRSALLEYDKRENPLESFLEESSLNSGEEDLSITDFVTLMTIHSSKGLEFENVVIVGAEEEIFPSAKSLEETDPLIGLEEERRLFYVAMTRAEKNLSITYTRQRMLYGKTQFNPKSRFLGEIPPQYINKQNKD